MKTVLAIDPGTSESAYVFWNWQELQSFKILSNDDLLRMCRSPFCEVSVAAIEMVACYGMPVGKEVFETCLLIGRLQEVFDHRGITVRLVYRREIKLHHCMNARAKDSNIRQALIDKYGAPGTKKNPGLTYGIKSDLWSAFAIATYITESDNQNR